MHLLLGFRQPRICLEYRRLMFSLWVVKIPWRREWLPTPVLLPGESHGQRSLAGYSPWGCKEFDTTEELMCLFWSIFRFTEIQLIQYREFPYTLYPVTASHIINILHLSGTLIKTKKSPLLLKIPWILSTFHQFSINVLLLFQDLIQGTTLHLVVLFHYSPLVCNVFQNFLIAHDFDSFEES